MNSRDWVDWIVIVASILSSFGILATIGVYFWQKKDNKSKQREIDRKLLYFVNIKANDFLEKINNVLHLIDNEKKYQQIEMQKNDLRYVEVLECNNPLFYKINLRLSSNEFLDRNNIHASLGLFNFILEVDSLNEEFFNKTSQYIIYAYMYLPDVPDEFYHCIDKNELINFLHNTKDKIKEDLNRLSD
ncbi:hypothetical protein ACK6T9_01850 [Proteus vulgaris]|uniref:hypothetical protein n=1 Tax=Proteus vulgaris TaxID=585 RepID=UPI0039B5384E